MAEITYWQAIQQANLSRILYPGIRNKVPVKSTPIRVDGNSIRIQISSQIALLNPAWKLGAFAYWGIDSGFGFEKIIEPKSIQIPVNAPSLILVPSYLLEPWLQLEIPSWISDAIISVWKLQSNQQISGVNPMQISNPLVIPQAQTPYSPAADSGAQITIAYEANTVSVLPASAIRKGFFIKNESTVAVRLQLSATGNIDESPVELAPGGHLSSESVNYRGQIFAKWLSEDLNGRLEVVEFFA